MEEKKNIKMIVTDLDGTLLKDDKTISQYTVDVVKQLCDKGHKFVIATARPLRAAKKFLGNVEINAGIYHNGALIYSEGRKTDGFQINNAKQIIDKILVEYPDVSIAVESNDVLYSNFEIADKKADKIILEVYSLEDMKRYEKLLPKDLYIQLSENKIGMIMRKEATKSNGINYLAKLYGIDIKDVIAFGDDYNDVKNAVNDAKEVADEVCETNENDGVAKWIVKNVL